MQPVLNIKLEGMLPGAPTNFWRAELANGTLNVAGTGFEHRFSSLNRSLKAQIIRFPGPHIYLSSPEKCIGYKKKKEEACTKKRKRKKTILKHS